MAVQVQCGDCFQSFRVREELIGKTIRCKSCDSVIRVTRSTSTDTTTKARTRPVPGQYEVSDADEAEEAANPSRRSRAKAKRAISFERIVRWIYDTPWTFLVIAVATGVVASLLLPEKFDAGSHLVVIREVPIGTAYLLAGCIWYLAAGGFSDRRQMSFAEQWVANFKFRLQMVPICALIFGAIQLENIFGRLLCGAVVIGLVVWKARDVKPNEWRPLCLVFIGLAYIVPPVVAIVTDMRR